MSELITRKIDSRIEIGYKILVIISLSLILGIVDVQMILFLGVIIIGLYELYIYKTNEEFINLLDEDRNHFAYKLMMKYYKLGLLIFICLLPNIFNIIRHNYYTALTLNFNNIQTGVFYRTLVIPLFLYFGLIEKFVLRKNSFKMLIKYSILSYIFFLYEYSPFYTYSNIGEFMQLLRGLIYLQILYLFFNFNILYSYKKTIKKPTYLNYDLIISLPLIVIYEIVAYSVLSYTPLRIIPTISYFILLIVILGLRNSLKKRYKVKKTRYSKIVKYYFVGLVFILPLIFLIISPIKIENLASGATSTTHFVAPYITTYILITTITIVILILYKFKKYIFKYDFISTANKIYDRWM